ncbi:helix-turn-helix domain-containing protein [Acrocarpospora catenulata]|uniref:helix-turn-helix domain-containing protein n=1 Tax=Acrocarpospora catenulata TaxID=2836182 RepID=UPI001BDAD546|nr:helix-turn-helix transcriptional regulator [Acrocarpospora catenulata]
MAPELSPTVCRRRLAVELRRLREAVGLSGVQVADQLKWSTSKISRLENGQILPRERDVRTLLTHYRIGSTTSEFLLELASRAESKGWWDAYADTLPESYVTYVGLESAAEEMLTWQSRGIPGLLQTVAYARALNSTETFTRLSPGEVERRTQVRVRRQGLVMDGTLKVSAVVDESALLRRFGTEEVMRDQLRHLHELAGLPNVSVRVLALDGPHPIDSDSFVILKFPEINGFGPLYGDVVYLESVAGGTFQEDEATTYRFRLLLDHLRDAALTEAESMELIAARVGL